MSFEMRRFINDVEVREGAEITDILSTQPVLGRRLKAGAICEATAPERWRGVITADGVRVWTSESASASYEEANRVAREHADRSLVQALRDLFNQA